MTENTGNNSPRPRWCIHGWTSVGDYNLNGYVSTSNEADLVRKAFEVEKSTTYAWGKIEANFGKNESTFYYNLADHNLFYNILL